MTRYEVSENSSSYEKCGSYISSKKGSLWKTVADKHFISAGTSSVFILNMFLLSRPRALHLWFLEILNAWTKDSIQALRKSLVPVSVGLIPSRSVLCCRNSWRRFGKPSPKTALILYVLVYRIGAADTNFNRSDWKTPMVKRLLNFLVLLQNRVVPVKRTHYEKLIIQNVVKEFFFVKEAITYLSRNKSHRARFFTLISS